MKEENIRESNLKVISKLVSNNKADYDLISVKLRKDLNDKVNVLTKNSKCGKSELINLIIEMGLEDLKTSGVLEEK